MNIQQIVTDFEQAQGPGNYSLIAYEGDRPVEIFDNIELYGAIELMHRIDMMDPSDILFHIEDCGECTSPHFHLVATENY